MSTSRRNDVDERLAYYATLVDNLEDAVIVTDERFVVTAWNPGAERLYGWRAGEALGHDVADVVRLELGDAARVDRLREIVEQRRARFEVVAYRKDGSPVDVQLVSVAREDERGEATGYLRIYRDVGDRKRAQEAQEAQRRAEAILHSATEEFFSLDRQWRYTYANERGLAAAARDAGVTAANLLGTNIWERFPQLVGTPFHDAARRAVREQTAVELETHSPVTGRWVEARLYPSDAGLSVYLHDISARKRADEELREAHRRNEAILESITDNFVAVDRDWRYTYLNDRALRSTQEWLGRPITREELLGRSLWEVFPETVGTEPYVKYHEAVRDRRSVQFETYFAAKDVWFETHAYPSESGLSVYFRDVSERKRTEAALREAQRRSETILERVTDAFIALDEDLRLTYVNGRALEFSRTRLGEEVTRGDLLGTNYWELFPEFAGTPFAEQFHRALAEQTTAHVEVYAPSTERWLEAHVYPSKDGLSVYAHDITDRKSAEEERERRARQHALVADLGLRALASDDLQALMDEAVGLVARTLDVEFAGVGELAPRGEAVMFRAGVGWREGLVGQWIERQGRDSLMGYTLRRREPVIVEEIGSDRRFGAGEELRAHGVVSAVSVMIETPDGPFGVLAALSARRHSFSDADVAFVQSVANVLAGAVERGRAQERLGEVREIERRRIARDLHDEALQELTDALAQAAVGRHRGLAPPAAEKLVETLKRIGRQLRGAVYDLRITDEQSRPFPDALRALVETHRERAVDYDIALDIAEGTHRRLPDDHSGEVLRIVGEALTNARRHAGARHVVVRAGGDGRLYVEVTDDGRGFDPAAEPPRADSCGLRGMRERAALIGGELQVSSVPGSGTTVRLTLGLAAGDHARLQAARILLVEDHVAVREAVAAMLANEPDLDVVAQAGSMAEAREALGDVDVAIVDLGLPDGFGGDLIGELRAVNPAARALVLSASVDPAEISRAFAAGADGSLDKTAQLDEVAATVRRLLPAARQRS